MTKIELRRNSPIGLEVNGSQAEAAGHPPCPPCPCGIALPCRVWFWTGPGGGASESVSRFPHPVRHAKLFTVKATRSVQVTSPSREINRRRKLSSRIDVSLVPRVPTVANALTSTVLPSQLSTLSFDVKLSSFHHSPGPAAWINLPYPSTLSPGCWGPTDPGLQGHPESICLSRVCTVDKL